MDRRHWLKTAGWLAQPWVVESLQLLQLLHLLLVLLPLLLLQLQLLQLLQLQLLLLMLLQIWRLHWHARQLNLLLQRMCLLCPHGLSHLLQ